MSTATSSPGAPRPLKFTTLLWRVRPRRRLGSVARGALDEHLERAPDEALGPLARPPLHERHEPLHPLHLDLVRDLAGERRRLRAAPRRVQERERAVVADLLDDLEGLLEVGLRLPREPDDDVGGEGDVGDVLADQRDAVEVALARVGAAHRLQDPRRAGLQGQVDVLAQRVELGVGAHDVLAHVLRVRARVADAVEPLDGVERAQELGERDAPRAQVAPVGVDVLAEEGDLADAVGDEALDLGDELARRARDLAPARGGHDAVRAHAVAADRDLHPRLRVTARLAGRWPVKPSNSK